MSVRRLSTSSALNGFPKSPNIWDQTTAAATFDCIGTATLASATSAITFAGIPSTYTHLQLRMTLRSSHSTTDYAVIYTTGVTVNGANSRTTTYLATIPNSTQQASSFAPFIVDIPNYASSSKNKTSRNMSGVDTNGGGEVSLTSILYMSTTPITTITISSANANIVQHSHVSLYGIK